MSFGKNIGIAAIALVLSGCLTKAMDQSTVRLGPSDRQVTQQALGYEAPMDVSMKVTDVKNHPFATSMYGDCGTMNQHTMQEVTADGHTYLSPGTGLKVGDTLTVVTPFPRQRVRAGAIARLLSSDRNSCTPSLGVIAEGVVGSDPLGSAYR